MNKRDSEIMLSMLADRGYVPVEQEEDADVILFNTCCVREHAEQRVYSRMEQLANLKAQRPGIILGIGGCMAEKEGQSIFDRLPHVDLVLGTGALYDLPELLERAISERAPVVSVGEQVRPMRSQADFGLRAPGVRAWVSIAEGCDNRCAYCVVPMVRGPERSKPPQLILDEVNRAVEDGYAEVFLLGQNVNSYGHDLAGAPDFPGLLKLVNEVPAVKRVRFTTSHPKDMSARLMEALRDLPHVREHLHLPLQSGSTRILGLMNRGYTRDDYLHNIEALRAVEPRVGLTTDVIVGFPGETDKEFEETCSALEEVRFDTAYIFKFSPRPGTAAETLSGRVPDDVIVHRHRTLLDMQKEISREKAHELVGTRQQVLVEGRSPKQPEYATGRTRNYRAVLIQSDETRIGDEIEVKITEVKGWNLYGEPEVQAQLPLPEESCAGTER